MEMVFKLKENSNLILKNCKNDKNHYLFLHINPYLFSINQSLLTIIIISFSIKLSLCYDNYILPNFLNLILKNIIIFF